MSTNPTREIEKLIDRKMAKINNMMRHISAQDVYSIRIYGENIRGAKITTQNFDGSGDYVQLERQYVTYWDNTTDPANPAIKMAMGFVPDKDGVNIPGIVLGAGSGQGSNRGYITKDATGLNMYYIGDITVPEVSYIKLLKDRAQINGYDIFTKDVASPLIDSYINNASVWNLKLDEAQAKAIAENPAKDWNIPQANLDSATGSKINDGDAARDFFDAFGYLPGAHIASLAIGNAHINDLSADKINAGTLTGRTIRTAASGVRIELTDGDVLRSYNAAGQLHGIYCDPNSYADLALYNAGAERFRIYDGIDFIVLKYNGTSCLHFDATDLWHGTTQTDANKILKHSEVDAAISAAIAAHVLEYHT